MKAPNAYLYFNGECEAAFEFYRSVFGGEFGQTYRFADAPAGAFGEGETPANCAQKIWHIELPIADGVLMGCDVAPGERASPFSPDPNFAVNVRTATQTETEALFAKLVKGGKPLLSPSPQPWGGCFASLDDKFGVRWTLNFTE